MAKKTGTGVSLTDTDWEHVNRRIKALKLSSIAQYFELLVDWDRSLLPRKSIHADNSIHLFPEEIIMAAAESRAAEERTRHLIVDQGSEEEREAGPGKHSGLDQPQTPR